MGKFIRATRIDEIPQMIHILKGEMSLVGPRTERPYLWRNSLDQIASLPKKINCCDLVLQELGSNCTKL